MVKQVAEWKTRMGRGLEQRMHHVQDRSSEVFSHGAKHERWNEVAVVAFLFGLVAALAFIAVWRLYSWTMERHKHITERSQQVSVNRGVSFDLSWLKSGDDNALEPLEQCEQVE